MQNSSFFQCKIEYLETLEKRGLVVRKQVVVPAFEHKFIILLSIKSSFLMRKMIVLDRVPELVHELVPHTFFMQKFTILLSKTHRFQ